MDNLTHTLIGATMAQAGLDKKFGKGTLLTLIAASNIPDIDAFVAFFHQGPGSFLLRRSFTHSVVGIPLLSFLLAWILSRFYKHIRLAHLFLLSLLGAGVHVLFDLVNSYGVVLLYPFSRHRFELSWIFIVDLALWAIMLTPFMTKAIFRRSVNMQRWCRAAGILVAVYVATAGALQWRSKQILNRVTQAEFPPEAFRYVFPEPLGPHRFRGVANDGQAYSVFLIHPLSGTAEFKYSIPTDEKSEAAQKIRQNPFAQKLMWFAKAPVWKVNADGSVEVWDLRFAPIVLPFKRVHLVFKFSKDGRIIE